MADHLTPVKRSWNMSRIHASDTSIEVKVRKDLFNRGFRYRKNVKQLPGKPDIVLPKYRTVIFVHGCFWHRHQGCKEATMDQLSIDKFDVEHIAPKKQMQKLMTTCKGDGLPVSCIANLCYLPEYVNRSKREKNFYQDSNYLSIVSLCEIEDKYSFTSSQDLEWMDLEYESHDDWEDLKLFYISFCRSRFTIMKERFFKAMGLGKLEDCTTESDADEQTGAYDILLEQSETVALTDDDIDFVNTKVGPLAYILIRKLFAENRISESEKDEMYTKEFIKKAKIKSITYPILAHSRLDNRIESPQIRYYKKPILVNGEKVFISHEWFNSSRESLVSWYKSHY